MINLGILFAMSIQDYFKKYITTSMLVAVWLVSIAGLLQNTQLNTAAGIRAGIGALLTLFLMKVGKSRILGKGDYFVLIWLFSFGDFLYHVRALSYTMLFLFLFATGIKCYQKINPKNRSNQKTTEVPKQSSSQEKAIKEQKDEIPMIPFLWIGYLLMWLERGV